jgi:glycosyltransferase 2 family protein
LYQAVLLGAAVVAPMGFTLLGVMFAMAGHPERLHGTVLKAERVLPRRVAALVAGLARTFAEGLAIVRRPRRLVIALAWSLVLWLCIAAQLWILVRAFDIDWPFGGSFLVTAMLVVGVSVPTPGGVGGTHEALRLGLTSFYGADNDAAVGAAIAQHAVNFLPYLVLGLWFVAQDGLNLAKLREMSASARATSSGRDEAHEVTS